MSKASLKPNPPFSSLAGPSQCANAAPGSGLREGVLNVHAIPSPSLAGPSSWPLPALKRVGQGTDVNKGLTKMKNRTVEEDEIQRETAHRFVSCLALDHIAVLYPDTDTPFADAVDVVHRLLPYHILQHPKEDMDVLVRGRRSKVGDKGNGKNKSTDDDLRREIAETKFALECFKRRESLRERFRRVRIRAGKRPASDDQAYVLAQAVLEADSVETTTLSTELRNARMQLDKVERDKRATARPPYYPVQPAPYYRSLQYAYPQAYGSLMQVTPPPSATVVPPPPGSIPVQLPVTSLPALHALGILPVPAATLPPPDQPQPPAVMRGSSANGTMLSLEINVSLLQQAQMSGLAMVLNSLMSRGVIGDSATTSTSGSRDSSLAPNGRS